MTFDAAAVNDLFAQAQSHAMTLGLFSAVNSHEPKNAPLGGLACAIWVQSITPIGRASGLSTTTGKVELRVRIYGSALGEPQDAIDPAILAAASTLMAEYSGNLTLGGTVRNVDLLGSFGTGLSAQAGYVTIASQIFRVMEVILPIVINDLYVQSD